MLLYQKVRVALNSSNYKLYREKGYYFESIKNTFINVYANDLSNGSKNEVWVRCDYCGKIYKKKYRYIVQSHTRGNPVQKDACDSKKCRQQKKIDTCRKNFGVDHPGQSKEVTEKMKQSRLKNLGYEWAMQNPEVKVKTKQSLYDNDTAPRSKQQVYLCNLLNGELNYPVENLSVDILLPNKTIIEYNGGGHAKNVHAGVITLKEFEAKERKRDYFLKSIGYRIIKIISPRDYLPPDDKILELIDEAIKYMNKNNRHHYNIEFGDKIIDKNYGKLRRITKKDLEIQESKKGSFLIAQ